MLKYEHCSDELVPETEMSHLIDHSILICTNCIRFIINTAEATFNFVGFIMFIINATFSFLGFYRNIWSGINAVFCQLYMSMPTLI